MITLQKYTDRDSRFICPKCEKPYEFTRYINTDTNEYLADYVGKCNRESKCGYHYTPKQFYSDNGIIPQQTRVMKPEPKYKPPSLHSIDLVEKSRNIEYLLNCNFILFLNKKLPGAKIEELINSYKLGATKNGGIVYWQIDRAWKTRAGKIMYYNANGNRTGINWIHSKLKLSEFNLQQCFFGEHLLSEYPGAKVCIVESEKTAIIAKAFYPDFIWLATGSKEGLKNKEKMKAVYGREVTLFPDLGAFNDWKKIANKYRFSISDLLEKKASEKEKKEGLDLADYLLR